MIVKKVSFRNTYIARYNVEEEGVEEIEVKSPTTGEVQKILKPTKVVREVQEEIHMPETYAGDGYLVDSQLFDDDGRALSVRDFREYDIVDDYPDAPPWLQERVKAESKLAAQQRLDRAKQAADEALAEEAKAQADLDAHEV